MSRVKKKQIFAVDREKRNLRRRAPRLIKQTHAMECEDGRKAKIAREVYTSPEQAEARQIVEQLANAYIGSIEFYKTEYGGSMPHDEAVQMELSNNEFRRKYVHELVPSSVSWSHIAAVAEKSMDDGLQLWARVREAADDELESGRRAAKVAGECGAFALAQFLAIRDAFADQWQPQGGIESAMIDMLTVSFSLQMYWTTIAHERATNTHDEQRKAVRRYEDNGWKSPYQSEANAIEQAHRMADGYNRQFLRVLRQLRDLRRYAPPVIVNNGGQVNVAANGGQQVNVAS
jgi:hypothetical protein